MPEAMPGSNAQPMLGANHATYATDERNVRHQDSPKSSHVPDRRKPVDNGKSVQLPGHIWGRMATVAEDRGVSVADILVAAVHEVLEPKTREERVLRAVREGLTDRAVAERTAEPRWFIARTRRAAGLQPNRQGRQTTSRRAA